MNMSNNKQCIWIHKLMMFHGSKWIDYETQSNEINLKIHFDQLFICSGPKVLETLNMSYKLKGIYKGEVLILLVNGKDGVRKLRFQIRSEFFKSIKLLGQYFPVQSHNSKIKNSLHLKYRNLEEVLQTAVDRKDMINSELYTPPAAFNNFVKICLLDPAFEDFVLKTQEALKLL